MSVHPPGTPAAGAPSPADPFGDMGSGDTLELQRYFSAIRRRWAVLVACCVLAAIAAVARYQITPKEYRSTATIQIERKRLSFLALGQASYLEDWWNFEYYPTQYRLLRSRGMAERVIEELRLDEDPNFVGTGGNLTVAEEAETHSTDDDHARMASLGSRLQSRLQVNPIEGTQLVELTYRSSDPRLAAQIANGYAETFIRWGIEERNSTVSKASDTLRSQTESLKSEIRDLQRQLQALSRQSNVPLDPEGEVLRSRRESLDEQYNSVYGDRINKEETYNTTRRQSDEVVANNHTGGSVTEAQSEIRRLESEYDSKLGTFTEAWPEMVELREEIETKKDLLRSNIRQWAEKARQEARAAWQAARAQENRLRAELDRLEDQSSTLSTESLEYREVREQLKSKQEILDDLTRRQGETEVASGAEQSGESNVRLIDRAVVPSAAFRPVLQRDLLMALGAGLLLGLGSIVLLEFLDRTLKSPDELEKIMGVPTLAVIPDIDETARRGKKVGGRDFYGYGYSRPPKPSKRRKKAKGLARGGEAKGDEIELLPHHNRRLALCEAYRSLRTALLLSSAEELRVIAMTSAEPGEGKTATVTNLAVVLAQMGRRVLLVDADLRRPRIHKVFRVSNRSGLVNHLTGTEEGGSPYRETMVDNLYVTTCGPVPPNPSELLASDRMRSFLQESSKSFEFILLDTPPVLPVADALILGTLSDGVIICARAGALLREDAKACREQLGYADLRILGTVLNRYRTIPGRYTKRYHYYGTYESDPEEERTHSAA